ncbi:hypothetical protein C449_00170 [Halococcus saccharolyticus DSM 5350]|uniref:Uncharacterized protein n=1 Tax=Halococcus saccharolyticus DSM 5350 TaxID=1227455 RepID=M0MTP3_9EURY|nr:hypothetical protein C449_00170 [Halococcus saccharolyticus DSM 5350]
MFGHGWRAETDLAVTDAERAEERLVDPIRLELAVDAVGRTVVGGREQRAVRFVGKRLERRLARADEIDVAYTAITTS